MFIASLVDPAIGFPRRPARSRPAPRPARPSETRAVAESFISARTSADPLVALAYQQLETQTDEQFAALTDPQGPYRITVVGTREITPYANAGELIASVLTFANPGNHRPGPRSPSARQRGRGAESTY